MLKQPGVGTATRLRGVRRLARDGTESNRFAAESQNLWRDIFMAPHHLFGYNDAPDVIGAGGFIAILKKSILAVADCLQ